jgi:protein-disulfide isomerase
MQNKSKKLGIIAIAAVLLIGFTALVIHNYKTKTSFKYSTQNPAENKPQQNAQDSVSAAVNAEAEAAALEETRKNSDLLKVSVTDFSLGDKTAPVVIIEYASLSCPHCAAFARESFEKLKSEYIDSNKVRFVFRNFPLNQAALNAAMLASCQAQDYKGQETEKYYATIKALFKTQDSWAFDEKYTEKLEAIAKLDGMSSERFKSCITSKDLQEKILAARMEVAKILQIKSAPTFFINGEISEGYVDYDTIKKLVEKKLSEVKKS